MLTREEQKTRNTEFWEKFRKYMNKYRSCNGRKMNWLNYPSDVKCIHIRLQTDSKGARLCFDIQPKDEGVRSIIWEQMTELKKVLDQSMNYETTWIERISSPEGRVYSRIMWEKDRLNFYNEEDHHLIFEFLKDRLLEFDEFYQEFKEILISLTD
ncbi:MAG: DUF4268 domain-containing protein [Flavobacteriia bacterium]|jgi:hypothetical protein